MSENENTKNRGFLYTVERLGNKIPHPAYLFIWLFVIALALSFILAKAGVSVINPATGETVAVVNLMTSDAWANFLKSMGSTWMSFAPMITVPICTLGMAVATHSGMLNAVLKSAGLQPLSRPAASLNHAELHRLSDTLKAWAFPVTGTQGWDNAQVTGGGVPLDEIDTVTMQSTVQQGFYLAGEVLDVAGDCGGFNLHWAWCSGIRAGRAAAKAVQA